MAESSDSYLEALGWPSRRHDVASGRGAYPLVQCGGPQGIELPCCSEPTSSVSQRRHR